MHPDNRRTEATRTANETSARADSRGARPAEERPAQERPADADGTELYDTVDADPSDAAGADVPDAISRRSVLAASAAAAGGLALGSGSAAAEEVCNSDYGKLDAGNGWTLMDNRWGMEDAQQCIFTNADGSFGYSFDARGATCGDSCINYPEVFAGGRPWGDDSGIGELPARRGDVDELVLEFDADLSISGGEWDFAEEWWLIDGATGSNPSLQYEVMLVMDWGGGHSHPMVERNIATDQFGNQLDYWADYSSGGTEADFHIFRISEPSSTGKVDLTEIVDFMSRRHGVGDDLTLTGVEVGNEYWQGAHGEVTYDSLNLQVNGARYEAGPGGAVGGGGSGGGGWSGGNDGSGGNGDTSDGNTGDGSPDGGNTDDGSPGDDGSTGGGSGGTVAEIDPRKTAVDVGEYVGFGVSDTSGSGRHISDLSWSLGDGTTDSGWYTGHTYDSAGEYAVELTASASDGATTTHSVTVSVGGGSGGGASDGGSSDGSSNGGSSNDGSAGDGSTGDGGTDDGSSDDGSGSDGSNSDGSTDDGSTGDGSSSGGSGDAHATIDPSATSASVGERIYFSMSTSVDWLSGIEWDMGDGTTSSGTWHVAHAFDSPGTYTVTLETQSGESGSWTTDTVTIEVS